MTRTTFALGIAVLIGLVALIAWYTLRETENPPPEEPQARSTRKDPRPIEEIVEFAPDRPRVPRTPRDPAPTPLPAPVSGEKPATITGRVLGPDGEPVPGLWVVAGNTEQGPAITVTSAEGRFSIGVPAGTWDLSAHHPGASPLLVPDVVCGAGKSKQLGDLRLKAGLSISGRVVTDAGEPVSGATVHAFPAELGQDSGGPGLSRRVISAGIWGSRTVSGPGGEFMVAGLSEKMQLLTADRIDIEMNSTPEEVRPGSTGITIVVRKLRVLAGQVVSENDAQPVSGATVNLEVQTPRWGVSFKYRTMEDGRFAFDLSDDKYSDSELRVTALRVSAPGFEDLERTDVTMENLDPEAGFRVSLFPAVAQEPGTLKGRVVYDTGSPFRGELTLSFSREGKAGQIHRVATDSDGRFELPGVPPGEYSLRTATGASEVLADTGRRLVIAPGGEESVEFTVTRGGDVDVRVYGSDGQPLAGATLAWGERSAVTPPEGTLRLPDLAPGPTTLKVTAPGHREQTVEVAVVKDQAVPVEVRLRAD